MWHQGNQHRQETNFHIYIYIYIYMHTHVYLYRFLNFLHKLRFGTWPHNNLLYQHGILTLFSSLSSALLPNITLLGQSTVAARVQIFISMTTIIQYLSKYLTKMFHSISYIIWKPGDGGADMCHISLTKWSAIPKIERIFLYLLSLR